MNAFERSRFMRISALIFILFLMGWTTAALFGQQRKPAAPLFEDNFETLDPAWGGPNEYLKVENGSLVLRAAPTKSFSAPYNGALFNDLDATVEVRLTDTSDPANVAGGLNFWAQTH